MNQKKKVIFLLIVILLVIIVTTTSILLFSRNEKIIELKKSFIGNIQKQEEIVDTAKENDAQVEEKVDSSSWDTKKVKVVKAKLKENEDTTVDVPVPIGYTASEATGENIVNTGFVIYEGNDKVDDTNVDTAKTSRNQWVWVPVNNIDRIYEVDKSGKMIGKPYHNYSNSSIEPTLGTNYYREKYYIKQGMQGMTADRLLKDLQKQFEETIKSIKKYGGFYIGRYETGDISKTKPVVQAMNTDLININWYEGYKKLQYLGANKNVQASMIWGCLWDETIHWLIDSGGKTKEEVENRVSWGNSKDATFSYTDKNNYTQTKEIDSYNSIPTGSTDYTKANNIYDLVGNVEEWTLEGREDSGGFWIRGGSFRSDALKESAFDATSIDIVSGSIFIGARAYFYIK